jgi:hypothetical protein
MATEAAALETYDSSTIREDLQDAENMISPTETPFTSMIAGRRTASSATHEWPLTELSAVSVTNRVAEGEDAPATDTPVIASRRWNFTQISDKKAKVSDTSQRVDGAASIEKMAKQISYKLKELKRDCEAMMIENIPANPGAAEGATVRVAAGFVAFLITNPSRGATTGAAPTLSNTTSGYPDAGHTAGTLRPITEALFNDQIQACWSQGGEPRYALCSPANKRVMSELFDGFATKYKDGDDKKIINAVDIYESDFGQVQIVPDRFMLGDGGADSSHILMIDPDYVAVADLQPTRQIPLARTGHTETRLIQKEYTLWVGNEKAHGGVMDTNEAAS